MHHFDVHITRILSGAYFKANETYVNIINTNAWKKIIWLVINWSKLEE